MKFKVFLIFRICLNWNKLVCGILCNGLTVKFGCQVSEDWEIMKLQCCQFSHSHFNQFVYSYLYLTFLFHSCWKCNVFPPFLFTNCLLRVFINKRASVNNLICINCTNRNWKKNYISVKKTKNAYSYFRRFYANDKIIIISYIYMSLWAKAIKKKWTLQLTYWWLLNAFNILSTK